MMTCVSGVAVMILVRTCSPDIVLSKQTYTDLVLDAVEARMIACTAAIPFGTMQSQSAQHAPLRGRLRTLLPGRNDYRHLFGPNGPGSFRLATLIECWPHNTGCYMRTQKVT